MLAILRDEDLEKYVKKDTAPPTVSTTLTSEERDALQKWKNGDAKARTRIELSIGDSEMIHLSGANTAWEMWSQLVMVKEVRG